MVSPITRKEKKTKNLDPFAGFERFFRPGRMLEHLNEPVADMFEDEREVVVTVELPGVKKEDIKVNVSDSGLSLKVEEKSEEHKEEKKEGYYASYSSSRFSGHSQYVSFPSEVDASKAKATFKNGVLELRAPKTHKGKAREVKVE